MRTIFAVSVLAVLVPRDGVRGCGSPLPEVAAEPAEEPAAVTRPRTLESLGVRIDLDPPSDARIYPVCLTEDEALWFRPPRLGFAFEPGRRLGLSAPCTLYVYRRDGAFFRRSAPVEIRPEDDGVVVAMPPEPIAGIGISFDPEPDGIHILTVIPLGPSEGLLEVGEVIVAVDGRPTVGIATSDVMQSNLGAAGTRVVLEVDDATGNRRTVEVVRDTIGVDDPEQDLRAELEAEARAQGLRSCYTPLVANDPELSVDLELSFTVDTLGDVGRIVAASSPSSRELEECVYRKVRGWTFTQRSDELPLERTVKFRPR